MQTNHHGALCEYKFNLTQFECRIQNLINLLVNTKNPQCLFPTSIILNIIANQSCHHFSVIIFDKVYFFLWSSTFTNNLSFTSRHLRRIESTLMI